MSSVFDEKWSVFEKRVELFKHIPFAEFVLLSGSMATGQVHEGSDFDVIVGTRNGRVWTTWFLSSLFFQLRGWREHPGVDKSNRIALPHFAAPEGYGLNPPYDEHWRKMYLGLIPALGDKKKMDKFFLENRWLLPAESYKRSDLYIGGGNSWLKHFFEWVLGRKFGDVLEKILKKFLIRRIEKNPEHKLGKRPRYIYNDDRLEFYPLNFYHETKKN